MLRLSRAVGHEEELQSQWDAVCSLVEAGQLADAAEEQRVQEEYQLELFVSDTTAPWSATGSPHK